MKKDLGDKAGSSRCAPEAASASSPSRVTIPIAPWLNDALIQPLAAAICFGTFARPDLIADSAEAYWQRVHDDVKEDYRRAARKLLVGVLDRARLARPEMSEKTLAEYMAIMRLSSKSNARKHYAAIYATLPTIWQDWAEAQGIEAGTAETRSGSVHESPVPEGNAPK